MTEQEKILSSFNKKQRQQIEQILQLEKQRWEKSLKPEPGAFGMRRLPRVNPDDPNSPFLPKFRTEEHEYTIVQKNTGGIGFERATWFHKLSIEAGYCRSLDDFHKEMNAIKHFVAAASKVTDLRVGVIERISGIQHAILDLEKEKLHPTLLLCTCFILREDEDLSSYSLEVAEEKIQDWFVVNNYSELDFFLLAMRESPAYLRLFRELIETEMRGKEALMGAISTNGKLTEKRGQENS